MENPWQNLFDDSGYICWRDRKEVQNYNKGSSDDHRFRTTLIPEPFIGDPESPIVMLNANPGYDDQDETWHRRDAFKKASLDNLQHKSAEYPFYLLDPKFCCSPGAEYWRKNLRVLALSVSDPPDVIIGYSKIARKVLVVESCPYHSTKFKRPAGCIPSQEYSDALVTKAIKRNAFVVLIRQAKAWENRIDGLKIYHRKAVIKSPQCGYVSQGNMHPADWSKLTDLLKNC